MLFGLPYHWLALRLNWRFTGSSILNFGFLDPLDLAVEVHYVCMGLCLGCSLSLLPRSLLLGNCCQFVHCREQQVEWGAMLVGEMAMSGWVFEG